MISRNERSSLKTYPCYTAKFVYHTCTTQELIPFFQNNQVFINTCYACLWCVCITDWMWLLRRYPIQCLILRIYATTTDTPPTTYISYWTVYFQHLLKLGERCFHKLLCCEIISLTNAYHARAPHEIYYETLLIFFCFEVIALLPLTKTKVMLNYFYLLLWTLCLRETDGIGLLITILCDQVTLKAQRQLFLSYFNILILCYTCLAETQKIVGIYSYVAGKIGVRGASRTYFLKMKRGLLGWRPHKFEMHYLYKAIATTSCVLGYRYAIVYK